MTWQEFKQRLLYFVGGTLTSRKAWLAALASYAAWETGHPAKIPYILLALMAGIAIEDAALKLGIDFPFARSADADTQAEDAE